MKSLEEWQDEAGKCHNALHGSRLPVAMEVSPIAVGAA